MDLDASTCLVMSFVTIAVLFGLGRIYFDSIQDFFLRRILYAATRLVILIQNTGDGIYSLSWKMIRECLDDIGKDYQQLRLEEIFEKLFIALNRRKDGVQYTTNPALEERVIIQAIHIATVWKMSIRSELEKMERMFNLKVDVKKFIQLIDEFEI